MNNKMLKETCPKTEFVPGEPEWELIVNMSTDQLKESFSLMMPYIKSFDATLFRVVMKIAAIKFNEGYNAARDYYSGDENEN